MKYFWDALLIVVMILLILCIVVNCSGATHRVATHEQDCQANGYIDYESWNGALVCSYTPWATIPGSTGGSMGREVTALAGWV